MSNLRSTLLALALLPITALAANAAPTGQVSLFGAGLDPISKRTTIAPGVDLGLGTGGGAGAALTLQWTDSVATHLSLGAVRLPLHLAGSAAASSDGGTIGLLPVTLLGERRFGPRGRTEGWLGVGVTLPFVARVALSSALHSAGIGTIRRPDHPALALGAGMDVALSPRTAFTMDLRFAPVAETLVVVPRGAVLKSQRSGVDFRPATLSAGLAWRAF